MADRYASLKQGLVGCWIPSVSGSGLLLPDLSGRGNNGSLVGMDASDWVSASYGRALDFDGVNDYVLTSNAVLSGTGDFTVTNFFKINTASRFHTFQGNFTASNLTGIQFGIFNTNKLFAYVPSGSSLVAGTTLNANQWYSACVVRQNGVITIYLNGVPDGSATRTGSIGTLSNWRLGQGDTGEELAAQLDDARVYNRALSESEIKLLASEPGIGFKRNSSAFATRYTYNPPKAKVFEGVRVRDHDYSSLRQGLVGAWCPSLPNGGSGNLLVDQSQRGNHGVLTNMSAGALVSGQHGRALDFDGVDDFVDFGSNVNLAGFKNISYSAWVFRATLGQMTPFARYVNTAGLGANRRADNFAVTTYTAAGQVYCGVSAATATGTDYIEFYSTETIVANQWNHIAAALFINGNSSSGKIWINGKSATVNIVYSGTPPTEFATNVSTGLYTINRYIGGNGVAVFNSGIVDDVRAYNRRITDSEAILLASRPGIGLQPSPTKFIAREKKTGLRRKILTGLP